MADRPADALRHRAEGDLPANVALMHLLIEAGSAAEAERALAEAIEDAAGRGDARAGRRLGEMRDLWRANPGAWDVVRSMIGQVDHGAAPGRGDAVAAIAASFDAAATASPEAGVALYALGDPGLLARATAEVVGWLRDRDLVRPDRRVLDLGCGIGRFEAAIAGEVRHVTGVDVSGEMIRIAAKSLADFTNVQVLQVAGRDLAVFAGAAFDLVLAVDSFPYLVQAGGDLARTHVREAARVLRPGGDLVILNYAYGGHPGADRDEVAAYAAAAGLAVIEAGTRPFSLWDGLAFHLRKGS